MMEDPVKERFTKPIKHPYTSLTYRLRWKEGSGRYHIEIRAKVATSAGTTWVSIGQVKKDYNLAGTLSKWKGETIWGAVCGMVGRRFHAIDCVLDRAEKKLLKTHCEDTTYALVIEGENDEVTEPES